MRTFVYVGGFNLYYRALKGTRHRWLDLLKFSELTLPASARIIHINYYAAWVSGKRDPGMPRRQQIYFSALKTIPSLKIHLGKFQVHEVMMRFAEPLEFEPLIVTPPDPLPRFGRVIKTEEKGSDVALGAHLVRDAFLGVFAQAAIVTYDSDWPNRCVLWLRRLACRSSWWLRINDRLTAWRELLQTSATSARYWARPTSRTPW